MRRKLVKKIKRFLPLIIIFIIAILSLVISNVFIKESTEFRSKAAAPGPTRYLDEVFNFVKITRGIAYGQALDDNNQMQPLTLKLFQPSGDSETQRPAIVWLHGGGFTGGSPVEAYTVGFAKRGYVAAAINYRLVDLATRNAQLQGFQENPSILPPFLVNAQHDALAAVRWFRANASEYKIDPDRIIVGGSSAGAFAALYSAYNYEDAGNSGNPGYSSTVSAVINSMGGMIAPEIWIKANDPPAGIFIGDLDPFLQYALDTKAVLEQLSIPVTMPGFGNVSHVLKGDKLNPFIARFLYDQLFLNAPFPSTSPQPLPSPQYSQEDIESSCHLIDKYTNLETYTGTAKEKQKLQRLINLASKTGLLSRVDITNVDQLLEFYNTYCKPTTSPPPLSFPTPTPQPTTTSPLPTTSPQPLPSPQYSQEDIEFSCHLINKYTNLETYTGTAKEKQKLQRLINFATKTGRNKVNITNVDQLLEFYNTYCN